MLMQENRSFDHYFGTLAGVRGFDDPKALKLATGRSVFYQPDPENPSGYLLPFHLDTRTTSAQKIPSTSHAWEVQHDAWNGGKMDNWLPAHRKADGGDKAPYVMGYHTRADIPFQFALAEAFTLCDAYHCSVMGPTWPNRMYWMTGTIDPDGEAGGPMTSNKEIPKGFRWTTYAERLEQAGVSWKVYQQKDNYGCNMLENFQNVSGGRHKTLALHLKGMVREPEGQIRIRRDERQSAGGLVDHHHQHGTPEHPDFMPAAGAAFVASKIDAIAANPEVWAKTAFILNYDENDGIFDHVAAAGRRRPARREEFVRGLPIGGGFRVPCIIVSPWTAGGWVCSQPFDHTSVLQFLEKFTGVKEPNISDWRRQTFGDLTAAFRFDAEKANPPQLPDTGTAFNLATYEAYHLPKPTLPGAETDAAEAGKGLAEARAARGIGDRQQATGSRLQATGRGAVSSSSSL